MSDDFTREIKIYPGYDHRDDPDGQRGAHGCDLVLILRGEAGAIAAQISTGWMAQPLEGGFRPGGEQRRRRKPGLDYGGWDNYPSGSYVGAHCTQPRQYNERRSDECEWLGGVPCYGDGSYTASDKVLHLLVTGGDGAAFKHLEHLYHEWIFGRSLVEEGKG